jgi:hypothetical protein
MTVTALRPPSSDPTAAKRARRYRRRKKQNAVTEGVTRTVTQRPGRVPAAGNGIVTAGVTIAALFLAAISGSFSVVGLTAIFPGAFYPVAAMGTALELGKCSAVVALGRIAMPASLRIALIVVVAVLMLLNSIGAFGFLSRAHIDQVAGQDAHRSEHAALVADLDRRIGQIDTAVNTTVTRGFPAAGIQLAQRQADYRAGLLAQRQKEIASVAALDAAATTDSGPLRYLASLTGYSDAALLRCFILCVALLLDPFAVALLYAANAHRWTHT